MYVALLWALSSPAYTSESPGKAVTVGIRKHHRFLEKQTITTVRNTSKGTHTGIHPDLNGDLNLAKLVVSWRFSGRSQFRSSQVHHDI